MPATILDYVRLQDLQLWSFAGAEAQLAAVADDIAYDAHDIDDGLRAGLFALDDIATVPLPGRLMAEIRAAYPGLDDHRLVHELIRRLIGLLIDDVVAETGRQLAALDPRSADDVRRRRGAVAGFSPEIGEADRAIKAFLKPRMYRHRAGHAGDGPGCRCGARPVRALQRASRRSAGGWAEGFAALDDASRARRIADFIAGMTDRYALAEHRPAL